MAGLCVKGHFALASLPVSGKLRGLHGFSSSSCCHMHTITAKAGPKLETKGPKHTSESITFLADIDGKQVEISLIPEKQPVKGKRKGRNLETQKNDAVGVDVHADAKTMTAEEEKLETHFRDVEVEDNTKDYDEEGTEGSEDSDEEETNDGLDAPELEEVMEMFIPPGAVFSPEKPLSKLPGSNIYLGPHARSGRVKVAEFVKSSPSAAECPSLKLPEFAMVGRSNVGKSSLINSLVQRKDLAQTSKKPGKTQLINHFIINKSWYLVDLPGYGYAKVPASVRATWDGFTKEFFLQSKSLVCVMLLVDASIPPQQVDLEYAHWLRENKVPMTIVFTKCDRKKKKKNGGRKPVENIRDFLKSLKEKLEKLPPWIMTSCVTNQGKDGLLLHMAQLRNYWSN